MNSFIPRRHQRLWPLCLVSTARSRMCSCLCLITAGIEPTTLWLWSGEAWCGEASVVQPFQSSAYRSDMKQQFGTQRWKEQDRPDAWRESIGWSRRFTSCLWQAAPQPWHHKQRCCSGSRGNGRWPLHIPICGWTRVGPGLLWSRRLCESRLTDQISFPCRWRVAFVDLRLLVLQNPAVASCSHRHTCTCTQL